MHSSRYLPAGVELGESIIAFDRTPTLSSEIYLALTKSIQICSASKLYCCIVVGICFVFLESCMVLRETMSEPLFAACTVIA